MALPLLPIAGGLWAWFVGLFTSTFSAFTAWMIGKIAYEKAVQIALVTAFLVAAAALTVGVSLSIKALIIGARVAMPNSLGMATYFLPSNVNTVLSIIVTMRVSAALYRWTVATMGAYVPGNPNTGLVGRGISC